MPIDAAPDLAEIARQIRRLDGLIGRLAEGRDLPVALLAEIGDALSRAEIAARGSKMPGGPSPSPSGGTCGPREGVEA